jgi:hypothetical protein
LLSTIAANFRGEDDQNIRNTPTTTTKQKQQLLLTTTTSATRLLYSLPICVVVVLFSLCSLLSSVQSQQNSESGEEESGKNGPIHGLLSGPDGLLSERGGARAEAHQPGD